MNHQENNRLDYMAAELDSLKNDVAEVKAIVKDMHTLLSGNPIDKDSNGMIGDLRNMKKEVYELKSELKKYKNYFYALVTLVGLGALKVWQSLYQAQEKLVLVKRRPVWLRSHTISIVQNQKNIGGKEDEKIF
jgi:hypothetical protein